jgi:hypothetical protein
MWFQALHAAGLIKPLELALLRHTGVSLVTWATRRHGNLPYEHHQERAPERELPIVVLTPREPPA